MTHEPFCEISRAKEAATAASAVAASGNRPPLGAKPVWLRLEEAAAVNKAKDAEYGESYLTFGTFAAQLFPNGITLQSEESWGRFACLFEMMQKLHRYSRNFDRGGHADSLTDIAVYSQMLARLDDLANRESPLL